MNELQMMALKEASRLIGEAEVVMMRRCEDMGKYAVEGSAFNEISCKLRNADNWTKAVITCK